MTAKKAIIIGAGPAGLTAAYELLDRTDVTPIVLEMSDYVGGIARTVNYKGNRIDIGPHRFFSKSNRVMEWWLERMPLQKLASGTATITYQQKSRQVESLAEGPDPDAVDHVMLVLHRKTRIYFLRKFFDYPLRLTLGAVAKLGFVRMMKIAFSYAKAVLFATKKPTNLEEFFISRFGRELYLTFFKSYTEKVWGKSCSEISAEWGAQRIKGLSIGKALAHFLKGVISRKRQDIHQKSTETSLIEQFLYPKYGPGQMWGIVADEVKQHGGEVLKRQRVTKLHVDGNLVTAVDVVDLRDGRTTTYTADYVFSTMPVKELIEALDTDIPSNVQEVSNGLVYRDMIIVGLLLRQLKVREKDRNGDRAITDNWIYIQESDVLVGRLQIYNNWGPYMVDDPDFTWIGLEYFCNDTDDLWKLSDEDMIEFAKKELVQIDIIHSEDVLDGMVMRMPKTYPAYFGTYDRFDEIREFVNRFSNLFLVGRNGMHKYNNQDHAMLTAMVAVDNIVAERTDKTNIWDVNVEQEYHELKKT